ncbi:hypothetical protein Tco_0723168 [Tanacetum coccineum]
MNTKFVNNLLAYWGKYVTNVKQNMDISTTSYVQIYTHLKAYEPHAKKTLKKQEQSESIFDPLYVAHTTSAPALPSPSTSSSQPTAQSSNDALMATMTQIANLLSGFQKQFPPTNNLTGLLPTPKLHATVHDGEGHVARQCKEPKRAKDSQYFKDKMLLMEAKEKGATLDAEAKAFLADVECTAPYDQPLHEYNKIFEVNHEDAYDSASWMKAPMLLPLSWPTCHPPVPPTMSQEMQQEEHSDFDAENEIDENTISYDQYLLDKEAQRVPTDISADTSDKMSMIAILTDLQTKLDGHFIESNKEARSLYDGASSHKLSQEIDTVSYHKLFDVLKQFQNEVNDIRSEKLARSANPLALLAAAQPNSDNYYEAPVPQRSNAPSFKQSSSTRTSASTRHKGKEIAKPVTPQSESVSEEDSDQKQARRIRILQKNLALLAKYFKKLYKPTNNNLRTSSNSTNKTEDTTPRYNNDNQSRQFGNQRTVTVAGARETVGSPVVQKTGIQCFKTTRDLDTSQECRSQSGLKNYAYTRRNDDVPNKLNKVFPLQRELIG